MNSISIMQPYIFPYIGYFHLIESTDKIVFYDDVNFKKKGWIHRNNILLNGSKYMFTFPLKKASQNKKINDIKLSNERDTFNYKFLKTIEASYKNAPHYEDTYKIIKNILYHESNNIEDLAIFSIKEIYNYIGRKILSEKSSVIAPESINMDKADRLIYITKKLGFKRYINLSAGRILYDKKYFYEKNLDLKFVESNTIIYKQFNNDFVENLSVIDVLMFNSPDSVRNLFKKFYVN